MTWLLTKYPILLRRSWVAFTMCFGSLSTCTVNSSPISWWNPGKKCSPILLRINHVTSISSHIINKQQRRSPPCLSNDALDFELFLYFSTVFSVTVFLKDEWNGFVKPIELMLKVCTSITSSFQIHSGNVQRQNSENHFTIQIFVK